MAHERELEAALEAAELAGRTIRAAYTHFQVIPDARADITTEVDRQSQETILTYLQRTFPGDAFSAEEDTPALAGAAHTGARVWVIDPIDGTRGFARKNGEFSVMVGFLDEGRIVVGVVLEPASWRITYATRGGGCFRRDGDPGSDARPVACRVTPTRNLAAATLVQSHSRNPQEPTPPVRALKPARVRETYSAGVKLALVARGEVDLYVNTYEAFHDWDSCAGQILVEEAGGIVTGLKGETLRYGTEGAWQRDGLLATNGLLHPVALQGLQMG